ncbi:guanyl-specific ribonuclease F1 [Rhizodiscina lignyota]|uniref:ribonuclease T1 n=1 Tax=Rhizodiscina lignyota TaxID=1504668 RepID=A0A9P4I9E0_9PEZI|nr:guanyl-specific ribonuclease F1 [Rhizodiscina lignyota]
MKVAFALIALVSTALAVPAQLKARQGSTCCGDTCYSSSDIQTALDAGFEDYQDGDSPSGYPHTYNNFEGFDFPVDGPYQEFPITGSSPFTGGSPGADRVVFNTDGDYAGAITHTGASGNDFVGCSGTS